jgi:choline-glycine betaine transporter
MNLWGIFVIMLYFSKYSQIKLGQPDDKPEYNDVTWFVMLFACGIGVGMFFYGVAEPVYHYVGANRYFNIAQSSIESTSQMLHLCVGLTNITYLSQQITNEPLVFFTSAWVFESTTVLCITNTWASVNSIWQMLCSAGLTL